MRYQCDFCQNIFDESEFVPGAINFVPYGEGMIAEGQEMECPFCGESSSTQYYGDEND